MKSRPGLVAAGGAAQKMGTCCAGANGDANETRARKVDFSKKHANCQKKRPRPMLMLMKEPEPEAGARGEFGFSFHENWEMDGIILFGIESSHLQFSTQETSHKQNRDRRARGAAGTCHASKSIKSIKSVKSVKSVHRRSLSGSLCAP